MGHQIWSKFTDTCQNFRKRHTSQKGAIEAGFENFQPRFAFAVAQPMQHGISKKGSLLIFGIIRHVDLRN